MKTSDYTIYYEKHKFGVLYENGKLENHWLTNEEVNNKTR